VLTLALVLGAAQGPVWAQAAPSSEDSINDADGDADVDGEILVKFKPGTSEAKKKQVIANKGDQEKEEKRIPKPKLIDIRVIGVNGDEENKAKDYEKDPNVQYAEPNFIYHPSATTANDTNFANLYGLNNTGQTVNNVAGTDDADIDAPEAWEETSGGTTGLSDTVVAIIDNRRGHKPPRARLRRLDQSERGSRRSG
jgi:Fervidolysin N-terminal prodomain